MRAGLPLHSEGDASLSPLLLSLPRDHYAAKPCIASPALPSNSDQSSVPFTPNFSEEPKSRCTSSPPRKALRTSLNCTPCTSPVAPMADLGAINQLFSMHPPGSSSWGGSRPELVVRKSEVIDRRVGVRTPSPAMTRSPSCISTSGMTPLALAPVSRLLPESSLGLKRVCHEGMESKPVGGTTRSRIQRLKRARDQAIADAASEARTPECATAGTMHHPGSTFGTLPHTIERGGEPEVDGGWAAGAGRDLMKLLDNSPAVGQQIRSQIVPCLVEMPECSNSAQPKSQNPPPPMESNVGHHCPSPYLSDYLRGLNPLGRGSYVTQEGNRGADPDGLSPTDPFSLAFYECGSESDQTLLETMLQEESQIGMQQTVKHELQSDDVVTPKSESCVKDEFVENMFEEQEVPGKFPRFASCRQFSLLTADDWMETYGTSQRKTHSS